MTKLKSPAKEALKFHEKYILTWGRTGHFKVVFGVILRKTWELLLQVVTKVSHEMTKSAKGYRVRELVIYAFFSLKVHNQLKSRTRAWRVYSSRNLRSTALFHKPNSAGRCGSSAVKAVR